MRAIRDLGPTPLRWRCREDGSVEVLDGDNRMRLDGSGSEIVGELTSNLAALAEALGMDDLPDELELRFE